MRFHLKTGIWQKRSSYKFILQAKVELTTEEESLINFVGTKKVLAITEKNVGILIPEVSHSTIKIVDLLVGLTMTFDDIDEFINAKNHVRVAAKNLAIYLRHLGLLGKVETSDLSFEDN